MLFRSLNSLHSFVVRGLMSSNECKLLSEAVQHLTNEALEVYPHAALGRGTDPTAVTRRRNSQHHTPCQVANKLPSWHSLYLYAYRSIYEQPRIMLSMQLFKLLLLI